MKVTISATIRDEYWTRCPDHIPAVLFDVGTHDISADEARRVLDDAVFNADAAEGPEEMPPGTRRAYAALAKQLQRKLA